MTLERQGDAAFFGMIHELGKHATEEERRVGPRRPYPVQQFLAPFDGLRMPIQSEFHGILCHDLTSRGFSYYADAPPTHQYVVVALGEAPFRFFSAQVRWSKVAPSEEGRSRYLVGCRFLRRIKD